MTRLPPLPREKLSSEQQALHDSITTMSEKSFGPSSDSGLTIWSEPNGALIGPYPFFLSNNAAGARCQMALYGQAPHLKLPPDVTETAILTVAAHYQAAYPIYAHRRIATKAGLLSAEQVDAILRNTKPEGVNEACGLGYDIARYLCGTPGPLPQRLWDTSCDTFGRDGTTALVHYIGFYSYTCIATNACDAPAPA